MKKSKLLLLLIAFNAFSFDISAAAAAEIIFPAASSQGKGLYLVVGSSRQEGEMTNIFLESYHKGDSDVNSNLKVHQMAE